MWWNVCKEYWSHMLRNAANLFENKFEKKIKSKSSTNNDVTQYTGSCGLMMFKNFFQWVIIDEYLWLELFTFGSTRLCCSNQWRILAVLCKGVIAKVNEIF